MLGRPGLLALPGQLDPVPPALREPPDLPERQVLRARMERERLDRPGRLDRSGRPARMVLQVRLEQREPLVQVRLAQLVPQVPLERRGRPGLPEREPPDRRGQQVQMELQDLPEPLAPQGRQVPGRLALQGRPAQLAQRVPMVLPDRRARRELQAQTRP